jgi:hypothetical protein
LEVTHNTGDASAAVDIQPAGSTGATTVSKLSANRVVF